MQSHTRSKMFTYTCIWHTLWNHWQSVWVCSKNFAQCVEQGASSCHSSRKLWIAVENTLMNCSETIFCQGGGNNFDRDPSTVWYTGTDSLIQSLFLWFLALTIYTFFTILIKYFHSCYTLKVLNVLVRFDPTSYNTTETDGSVTV